MNNYLAALSDILKRHNSTHMVSTNTSWEWACSCGETLLKRNTSKYPKWDKEFLDGAETYMREHVVDVIKSEILNKILL